MKLLGIEIICVVLATISRCIYIIRYPVLVRDSFRYAEYIYNICNGLPVETRYPPLSIYLMKIPYVCFNLDIIQGAIIVNAIAGTLSIIAIAKIAMMLSKSSCLTICIGSFFAVHETLLYYSTQVLRDGLFLLLALLSLHSILLYDKRKRIIIWGALTSIAAFFTRYEGLEIVLFWTMFLIVYHSKETIKKTALHVFAYVCLCLLFWEIGCMILNTSIETYLTSINTIK